MGDGKNMIEQAITYHRSRTEGCELSCQNRAGVRGYTSTCNTSGPFVLIAHSRLSSAVQPVIQLLVSVFIEKPQIAQGTTARRQGCRVGKKIPTAPAPDWDMITYPALHFRRAQVFPIRSC